MRGTVLAVVAAASLGCAVWIMVDPGVASPLATNAGLFISLVSLLMSVADFRPEPARPDPAALADDLALRLREQWLEEAEARQLRDPRVLPLAWRTTDREVADELRTARARVLRARLDGRLEGRFDDVVARLAEGWAQVPGRRLVAIGEPGSGKTVLAMLLTLGLLGVREQGGPVPVLLPVSSWDPVRERLDDWIVRTLAQPYYIGRADIPRTLLTHGLLLPVLDGLDEIPESARRSAIRGINHAIGGERPVVVTCRAVEYEELIRGGAPTLRRAAVVEISPVPAEDVIGYLGEVDWPAGTDWGPVFQRLRSDREGPLARALSTPLMVTSARLVYERGGGDPAELLDEERFDSAYAVEDHLIHGLVDAAYAPDPDAPQGAVGRDRWSAGQARRWLTFLATYLHDHRERDLAWWLLSGRLLSRWAGPVTGLGIGAALAVAGVLWMTATESIAPETAVGMMWVVGCVFALFNSLVWYASEARPPGRLARPVRGSAGRLLRGFRGGAAVALAGVSPLVLAPAAIRVIRDPGGRGTPRAVELYVEAVTTSAALAVVVGLALAAHNWLDAPPSRATHVSPLNSLSQDRRSALLSALVAGLVVASTGLLGWYAGRVSGDLLLRVLTNWAGWPGRPDVGTLAADRWHTVMQVFGDANMVLGVAMLLPGVFIALLVLMGRAWPRFVVARCYLAVRGKLPWRLMAFLADARHRELLRQAGGVYQFRHIRLQETLAGEPTFEERARAREEAARRARVRRRTVLAAGAGVLVAGTAWVIGGRRDESVARLALPGRKSVVSLAMRPRAGRQVYFAFGDGSVRRWSGDTADHSPELVSRVPAEWTGNGAPALAFSADGRFLLTAPYGAGGPEVQDVRGGRPRPVRRSAGDATAASHVAVHGTLLAWHNGSTVGVWRLSGNGRCTLVAKSAFDDVSTGQGNDSSFVDLGFLSDGSLLVMGDSGGLWRYDPPSFADGEPSPPRTRLWRSNVASANPYDTSDGIVQLAVGRDDSLALFGPGGGEMWQGNGTGWSSPSVDLGTTAVTGAFHPTLALLAVADLYGGDVQLWHTDEPRKARRLTGHGEPVQALDFSADGNWLATGSADGTVRIWDVRNP